MFFRSKTSGSILCTGRPKTGNVCINMLFKTVEISDHSPFSCGIQFLAREKETDKQLVVSYGDVSSAMAGQMPWIRL